MTSKGVGVVSTLRCLTELRALDGVARPQVPAALNVGWEGEQNPQAGVLGWLPKKDGGSNPEDGVGKGRKWSVQAPRRPEEGVCREPWLESGDEVG